MHIECPLSIECPLYTINVHCVQWTQIVYIMSIGHNERLLWTMDVYCVQCYIVSIVHNERPMWSMDVYCVYCVHCVHHTYYAYWTKPTKVQPSTNWCRVGVSIVNTKMDTMDIHCVHWTCPLVIKNGQTLSIVSIGDHWTFSTIEVHDQWTSNGRPMWTMDGQQCEQYDQW